MGMGGGGGGKQAQPSLTTFNSTSTVTPPAEVLAMYRSINPMAAKTAATPWENYGDSPDAFVAGMNPTQTQGIQGIIDNIFGAQPAVNQGLGTIGSGIDAYGNASGMVNAAGNATVANNGIAAMSDPYYNTASSYTQNAATAPGGYEAANPYFGAASADINAGGQGTNQVSDQDIFNYMSPFQSQVVDATMGMLGQQNEQAMSGALGNVIRNGGFGGDRAGIMLANQNQQNTLANAKVLGDLNNQNYAQAANMAVGQRSQNQADLQRRLAAGQAQGQIGSAAGQLREAGLGRQLSAGQQMAGIGTAQRGAYETQQQMSQADFNRMLQAGQSQAQIASGLGQLGQAQGQLGLGLNNQIMQNYQAQVQGGTLQQQTEQAGKDAMYNQWLQEKAYPFLTTQWLADIYGGLGPLYGSTTSQSGTSMSLPFSDPRVKTGVGSERSGFRDGGTADGPEVIGKSFTGKDIYRYKYKQGGPAQLGMMADERLHDTPEAVHNLGGVLAMDYARATDDDAEIGHQIHANRRAFASGGGDLSSLVASYGSFMRANKQGQNGQTGPGGTGFVPQGKGKYGQMMQAPPANVPKAELWFKEPRRGIEGLQNLGQQAQGLFKGAQSMGLGNLGKMFDTAAATGAVADAAPAASSAVADAATKAVPEAAHRVIDAGTTAGHSLADAAGDLGLTSLFAAHGGTIPHKAGGGSMPFADRLGKNPVFGSSKPGAVPFSSETGGNNPFPTRTLSGRSKPQMMTSQPPDMEKIAGGGQQGGGGGGGGGSQMSQMMQQGMKQVEGLMKQGQTFGNHASGLVSQGVQGAGAGVSNAPHAAGQAMQGAAQGLGQGVQGASQGLAGGLEGAAQGISGAAQGLGQGVEGAAHGLAHGASEGLGGIAQGAGAAAESLGGAAHGAGAAAAQAASSAAPAAANTAAAMAPVAAEGAAAMAPVAANTAAAMAPAAMSAGAAAAPAAAGMAAAAAAPAAAAAGAGAAGAGGLGLLGLLPLLFSDPSTKTGVGRKGFATDGEVEGETIPLSEAEAKGREAKPVDIGDVKNADAPPGTHYQQFGPNRILMDDKTGATAAQVSGWKEATEAAKSDLGEAPKKGSSADYLVSRAKEHEAPAHKPDLGGAPAAHASSAKSLPNIDVAAETHGDGGGLYSSSMNKYMDALHRIESGGYKNPYEAVGVPTRTGDRAYGKYQIMGANIPSWGRMAGYDGMTVQRFMSDPEAQEKIARTMYASYLAKGASPTEAAMMWLGGPGYAKHMGAQDAHGTDVSKYASMFNRYMGNASGEMPTLASGADFDMSKISPEQRKFMASASGGLNPPTRDGGGLEGIANFIVPLIGAAGGALSQSGNGGAAMALGGLGGAGGAMGAMADAGLAREKFNWDVQRQMEEMRLQQESAARAAEQLRMEKDKAAREQRAFEVEEARRKAQEGVLKKLGTDDFKYDDGAGQTGGGQPPAQPPMQLPTPQAPVPNAKPSMSVTPGPGEPEMPVNGDKPSIPATRAADGVANTPAQPAAANEGEDFFRTVIPKQRPDYWEKRADYLDGKAQEALASGAPNAQEVASALKAQAKDARERAEHYQNQPFYTGADGRTQVRNPNYIDPQEMGKSHSMFDQYGREISLTGREYTEAMRTARTNGAVKYGDLLLSPKPTPIAQANADEIKKTYSEAVNSTTEYQDAAQRVSELEHIYQNYKSGKGAEAAHQLVGWARYVGIDVGDYASVASGFDAAMKTAIEQGFKTMAENGATKAPATALREALMTVAKADNSPEANFKILTYGMGRLNYEMDRNKKFLEDAASGSLYNYGAWTNEWNKEHKLSAYIDKERKNTGWFKGMTPEGHKGVFGTENENGEGINKLLQDNPEMKLRRSKKTGLYKDMDTGIIYNDKGEVVEQ